MPRGAVPKLCIATVSHTVPKPRRATVSHAAGFRRFSLTQPFILPRAFDYDAIFLDPPFANVSPEALADCVRLMAPTTEHQRVPLFCAFPVDRGPELQAAFAASDGPKLVPKPRHLTYRSTVPAATQMRIVLFGPNGVGC